MVVSFLDMIYLAASNYARPGPQGSDWLLFVFIPLFLCCFSIFKGLVEGGSAKDFFNMDHLFFYLIYWGGLGFFSYLAHLLRYNDSVNSFFYDLDSIIIYYGGAGLFGLFVSAFVLYPHVYQPLTSKYYYKAIADRSYQLDVEYWNCLKAIGSNKNFFVIAPFAQLNVGAEPALWVPKALEQLRNRLACDTRVELENLLLRLVKLEKERAATQSEIPLWYFTRYYHESSYPDYQV